MSKVVRAEKVEKESLERELTPIPFGTRVRLRGLRTKPELNGQPGIIIGYDVDLMRCKVGMLVPDGESACTLVTHMVVEVSMFGIGAMLEGVIAQENESAYSTMPERIALYLQKQGVKVLERMSSPTLEVPEAAAPPERRARHRPRTQSCGAGRRRRWSPPPPHGTRCDATRATRTPAGQGGRGAMRRLSEESRGSSLRRRILCRPSCSSWPLCRAAVVADMYMYVDPRFGHGTVPYVQQGTSTQR